MNLPDNTEQLRLQVYLARSGLASRRACERYIAEGRVSVNGQTVREQGVKVGLGDDVRVDGKPVHPEEKKRYVLLYKPAGYVCSQADEKGRKVAASLIAPYYRDRLYHVGRLDMYSEGLILFTNDGRFAARISHPSSQIKKEYIVETNEDIPDELISRFKKGIWVDEVLYRCADAVKEGSRRVRITLIEGKNREIRTVFTAFDVRIKKLTRVRIGCLDAGGLSAGQFRELSGREISALYELSGEKR